MAYEEIVTTGNIPGISVKSKTSYITAKTTGDYTWLSETNLDGSEYAGGKALAVGLAANASSLHVLNAGSETDSFYRLKSLITTAGDIVVLENTAHIPVCVHQARHLETWNGDSSTYGNNYKAYITWNNSGNKALIKTEGNYPVIASGCSVLIEGGCNPTGISFELDNDGYIYEVTLLAPWHLAKWAFARVNDSVWYCDIANTNDLFAYVGSDGFHWTNHSVYCNWTSGQWVSYAITKYCSVQEA